VPDERFIPSIAALMVAYAGRVAIRINDKRMDI